ncbi:putative pseudouridine-5'-phosphatase [Frankliniella fusca]|uniref:Pseudouridine-5'-phosphatase n=1 Tax=Frankliniella fusca TaxID=407009 RepID=A0AAE1H2B5_9NEOP|nr:putative pseudouridine-5'-phosphatase [Frankliniella fusca]
MTFSKVTHVLFDMDGLLLDTEKLYRCAISEALQTYGKEYTPEVMLMVTGTTERDTVQIIVNEYNLPSEEEFHKMFKKRSLELLKDSELCEGAERLVRHLSKHGVPIAVATSSSLESVGVKTQKFKELFSLFHHVVSGSSDPDVKNGKPAPDIFLVCASRFPDKPEPEKCLVFEDAHNGIVGARCAGMQAVMVPEKTVPEEKRKGATVVLNSLLEFKPELFGLPPFDD